MTRGSAFLILKDKVLESVEFNGNMYPEGYGDDFLEGLKECQNEKDFKQFIYNFNQENFQYKEKLVYEVKIEDFFDELKKGERVIDFNNNYFERFFSDWVFFKNLSGIPIKFITSNEDIKRKIILNDKMSIRFNFGEIENNK